MVSEPQSMESDRPSIRLNSTNYALWEFQFRVFVEGKGLLSILDGTQAKPDNGAQAIATWMQNDARVRFWLLGSVDSSTCLSLRLYPTANRMWRHLKVMYSTVNAARQFEIRLALTRLEQGDRSVSEYFNNAQELWTEQDLVHAALRPEIVMTEEAIAERMQARLLDFLMKLRPEFEAVRATLLNRDILQFDGVLGTLVREETRLRTQALIDLRPGEGEALVASAAGQNRQGPSQGASAFAIDRPQFQRRVPISDLICHHCREKGHLQKHCRRRNFCVYCKRMGHIILDCRTKERNEAREGAAREGSAHSGRAAPAYRSGNNDRAVYGAYPTVNDPRWHSAAEESRWHTGAPSGDASSSRNTAGENSTAAKNTGGVTVQTVEQIVSAAISAAFATMHGTGFEDGESDRKGE